LGYLLKSWKGLGLLVLGILIFLLAIYLATSLPHSDFGYISTLALVGLAMMYVGFIVGFAWAPPGGESTGFGDCTICGGTDVGVAIRGDVNYCERCYQNGAAQAYFDGMDRQRQVETAPSPQPQVIVQQQPVIKEVIREKEIITKERWFRCPHCRTEFKEGPSRCPHCGAPA
jgi:hypothetical protein